MQTTEESRATVAVASASALRVAARPGALAAAGTVVFLIAAKRGSAPGSFDQQVTARTVGLRTPALNAVAHIVTTCGSEACLAVVTLVAAGLLLLRTDKVRAGFVLAAMTVSAVSTVVIKVLVNRPRPGALVELGAPEASYSFPSGHTLNSTVCYGIIALMTLPLLRSTTTRIALGSAGGVLVLAIGLSRLYLGYHWATDVLAGWTFGLIILALAVTAAMVWMRPCWAHPAPQILSGPNADGRNSTESLTR